MVPIMNEQIVTGGFFARLDFLIVLTQKILHYFKLKPVMTGERLEKTPFLGRGSGGTALWAPRSGFPQKNGSSRDLRETEKEFRLPEGRPLRRCAPAPPKGEPPSQALRASSPEGGAG